MNIYPLFPTVTGADAQVAVPVAGQVDIQTIDSIEGVSAIAVFLPGTPGPPGPALVDQGTRVSPAVVTTAIVAPLAVRQRSFIQGASSGTYEPTLPNGSGAMEWWLFGTDNVATVTLNNATNLLLSGQWIGRNGSMLYLQWDGVSQWVEGGRNEI